MINKDLTLYHTEGCHLCEEAEALLKLALSSRETFSLVKQDIALDDALFERYGVRIPVVSCEGRELGWPFSSRTLLQFLDQAEETA